MKIFSDEFLSTKPLRFMQTRIFVIVALNVLSFSMGYFLFNWKIHKYHVGEYAIVYHDDWPLYGLPLTEYSILLRATSEGDNKKVKKLLIDFLTSAIKDATKRSATATEKNKNEIRSTLKCAEDLFYKYRNDPKGDISAANKEGVTIPQK